MSSPYRSPVYRWLVRHWVCTYLLMGVGFIVFGAASLNLVQMVAANIGFLATHGLDAVQLGGLLQLLELLLSVYVAVAFYVLFKTCEHALVERVAHHDSRNDS